ncbi:MAG: hypothetical protein AAFQ98_23990 [Bacteroidota bacterium]
MTLHTSSLTTRYLWRVLFLYVVFYIYPYGFEYIYELEDRGVISFWPSLTIPFAEWVFGWEIDPERTSNGFNSMYDFARFTLIGIMALIGAMVWVIIEQRTQRNAQSWLAPLTRTILRYHVGFTLILYGAAKTWPNQFGIMGLMDMETTLGEQTPMTYLWNFMAYSRFYTAATGYIEVIGGLLLLFRRTTFAGAILTAIAMTSVVLIDIGYDVSVKMFAIHLWLMNFVILGPNFLTLWRVIVLHQAEAPEPEVRLWPEHRRRSYLIIKGLLLLGITVPTIANQVERVNNKAFDDVSDPHRITISLITVNGDTVQTGDTLYPWKSVVLNGYPLIRKLP